ncbi:MAG: ABC transporter permease subunit [FCB group bacterium]|nr:ABC transporter permease subunit [FCB group bacterium]
MKTPINLTLLKIQLHSLKKSMLYIALGLVLFELMMHWFISASEMAKMFSQFMQVAPPAMKNLLGNDTLGFYTPLGMLAIAYSHPGIFFIFLIFPSTFFSREIAAARERGILALLLSRPVSRNAYLFNLTILLIAGLIYLGLMTAGGVKLAFILYGIDQPFTPFFHVIINLVFLMLFLGSAAMLISILVNSSSSATGWMVGVPLILYLLEYISRTVKPLAFTGTVNPFHYYQPQTTLSNGFCSTSDCLILAAGTLCLITASFIAFRHKDI